MISHKSVRQKKAPDMSIESAVDSVHPTSTVQLSLHEHVDKFYQRNKRDIPKKSNISTKRHLDKFMERQAAEK